METTNLEKLAEDVAEILAKREDSINQTKVMVGEVALIVGATYIVTRLVQNVWYRHKIRKFMNS